MPRRRIALLLLSVAWLCHGVTILHNPGYRDVDEAIVLEWWPLWLRVAVWIVAGVLGAIAALARSSRAESWGYAAAVIPPALRVVSYLWSFAMWLVPGAPGGEWASLAYAGFWVSVLGLVYWMARWPEPGTPKVVA